MELYAFLRNVFQSFVEGKRKGVKKERKKERKKGKEKRKEKKKGKKKEKREKEKKGGPRYNVNEMTHQDFFWF